MGWLGRSTHQLPNVKHAVLDLNNAGLGELTTNNVVMGVKIV